MSGPSQGSEIASEAAMNKVYLKAVEKKIEGWLGSARRFDRSRSSQWTRTGEAVVHQPELEPLFGRVGLAIDDPDVGTGFYIGSWFVDEPRRVQLGSASRCGILRGGREVTSTCRSRSCAQNVQEQRARGCFVFG